MKTPALNTKGWGLEPHWRFFTPIVVLLSFNRPETVLWTIAKILLLLSHLFKDPIQSYISASFTHLVVPFFLSLSISRPQVVNF